MKGTIALCLASAAIASAQTWGFQQFPQTFGFQNQAVQLPQQQQQQVAPALQGALYNQGVAATLANPNANGVTSGITNWQTAPTLNNWGTTGLNTWGTTGLNTWGNTGLNWGTGLNNWGTTGLWGNTWGTGATLPAATPAPTAGTTAGTTTTAGIQWPASTWGLANTGLYGTQQWGNQYNGMTVNNGVWGNQFNGMTVNNGIWGNTWNGVATTPTATVGGTLTGINWNNVNTGTSLSEVARALGYQPGAAYYQVPAGTVEPRGVIQSLPVNTFFGTLGTYQIGSSQGDAFIMNEVGQQLLEDSTSAYRFALQRLAQDPLQNGLFQWLAANGNSFQPNEGIIPRETGA